MGCFWCFLDASWVAPGASCGVLEPLESLLGGVLGPLGRLLGLLRQSWGSLGASWVVLEPSKTASTNHAKRSISSRPNAPAAQPLINVQLLGGCLNLCNSWHCQDRLIAFKTKFARLSGRPGGMRWPQGGTLGRSKNSAKEDLQ